MSTDERVLELLMQWEEVYEAGQNLPASEFSNDPHVVRLLQLEIDRVVEFEKNHGDVICSTNYESEGTARSLSAQFQSVGEIDTDDIQSLETTASFRSIRKRDHGGRGMVYKAEHAELNRSVAIKILKSRDDPDLVARFHFEAQATSQLDHPGVAPVYANGEISGQPFYAMRFIDGDNLQTRIQQFHEGEEDDINRKQQFKRLIRYLYSATKTIAYAHKRSILNLDIKPNNIMVGKYGETVVIDWGEAVPVDESQYTHLQTEGPLPVARKVDGDSSSSHRGGGTLPYMPPERLPKGDGRVSARTDIYSLGASLYEILTGKPPFLEGEPTRKKIIDRIYAGELTLLDEMKASVPRPLDAVCRKAMAIDPAKRYASANELARDLECWLDDEQVQAYPERLTGRIARWARHNRGASVWIGSCIILVAILALAGTAILGQAWANANSAEKDCLFLAAQSTATVVGRDMEYRWRALESEAGNPKLVELISNLSATFPTEFNERAPQDFKLNSASQKPLQTHLGAAYKKWRKSTQAASMLVMDRHGRILARVPNEGETKKLIGRSFRFRDYFHGQGEDFPDEEGINNADLEPHPDPYVSIPFRGRADNMMRVQFTVPVKNSDDEVIGVLGMAVKVASFGLPNHDPNRPFVLWDRRGSESKGPLQNLILHHPHMKKAGLFVNRDLDTNAQIDDLYETAKWHALNGKNLAQNGMIETSIVENYHDPVTKETWRAAFAFVQARPNKESDQREIYNLVVIAQEKTH